MAVVSIKSAQKSGTKTETMLLTPAIMQQWVVPKFQRPEKENKKVREIAEQLQNNGGIISGFIILGTLPNDNNLYLMDGQHRRLAAYLSGRSEFIADVCTRQFKTMSEMGLEFVKVQQQIVRMTADDVLRGMEDSTESIKLIRTKCPFIGFSAVRRNMERASTLVGMAALLRAWRGSSFETPALTSGMSAPELAMELTIEEAEKACTFLNIAYSAWTNDQLNFRLWAQLNLVMSMWMWRTLVDDKNRGGPRRYVVLDNETFKKCLMRVSADADYIAWLQGRQMMERDRNPCYRRLRKLFTDVLQTPDIPKIRMPQPAWANN